MPITYPQRVIVVVAQHTMIVLVDQVASRDGPVMVVPIVPVMVHEQETIFTARTARP